MAPYQRIPTRRDSDAYVRQWRRSTPPATRRAGQVVAPGQWGEMAKLGFGEGARGGAAAGRGCWGGEQGGGGWASPADLREHDDDNGGESRARVRFEEHNGADEAMADGGVGRTPRSGAHVHLRLGSSRGARGPRGRCVGSGHVTSDGRASPPTHPTQPITGVHGPPGQPLPVTLLPCERWTRVEPPPGPRSSGRPAAGSIHES
jgi:hypothetical protein